MLEHTFVHLRGVGPKLERRLWNATVRTWDDARARARDVLSPRRAEHLLRGIDESRPHLASGNPTFFQERLPALEHWRLFADFRHSVAYVDIETTGMGGPRDYITAIALYDGGSLRTFVHGDDLEEFPQAIAHYRLLVTYNGKCFDAPFIERFFGIRLRQAHIDLRYILARLGYKGGLKGCERAVGIDRGELDGVDGYFAVRLWRDYLRNANEAALHTLLAYNAEDVLNLETLMHLAYNLNVGQTPFAQERQLPMPDGRPNVPFEPDIETIQRLRWDALA